MRRKGGWGEKRRRNPIAPTPLPRSGGQGRLIAAARLIAGRIAMPKTYRVAVIGRTGKGNYGHGLDVVWKALDNVEIVAVADPDEKGGRTAAAQRLGAKNAYADYKVMLDKEKPQIVSVADRWLDQHH